MSFFEIFTETLTPRQYNIEAERFSTDVQDKDTIISFMIRLKVII